MRSQVSIVGFSLVSLLMAGPIGAEPSVSFHSRNNFDGGAIVSFSWDPNTEASRPAVLALRIDEPNQANFSLIGISEHYDLIRFFDPPSNRVSSIVLVANNNQDAVRQDHDVLFFTAESSFDLTIRPDDSRGGFVDRFGQALTSDLPLDVIGTLLGPCDCLGDISGPTAVRDGVVSSSDLVALIGILSDEADLVVEVLTGHLPCMDLSGPQQQRDGKLSSSDLAFLIDYISSAAVLPAPCIVLP